MRIDRGSVSVELAILTPAFLLLIGFAVVAGRVAIAYHAIDLAAHDAARTASSSRDAATAEESAVAAAIDLLDRQGLHCTGPDGDQAVVTVDTSGFALPAGEPAAVRATVSCTVSFTDVALPGVPTHRRLVSTFVSPLDTYRTRS